MSIKILHILHDEKFIDGAIDTFNATSAINTYVSIDDNKPYSLMKKHVSDIIIIERERILSFIIDGGYNFVAFHTLTRDKYELVLQIPKNIRVLWLAWGYDLYSSLEKMPAVLPIELYKPLTKNLISPTEITPFIKRFKRMIKRMLYCKKHLKDYLEEQRIIQSEINLQNALLNRIDFMSTVLPSEYEMLCKLKDFHASYFPFQYAFQDDFPFGKVYENADKILIGNSATETNNHIDIISLLQKRNIIDECILPCSYGSDDYLQKLKKILAESYEHMYIIDNFLPQEEYVILLRSCKIGVFGHLRQQAIGNILICLLQGSKVYLYRDSMAYDFFSRSGYIVYTIEADLTNENISVLLTEEQRAINKKLAMEHFSNGSVESRLYKYLEKIKSTNQEFSLNE